MSSKRIVFATFGSLGDLHPYIAIARELNRRGHRPLIASFAEFREAVEAAGVEFAPMRPDMAGFGDKTVIMQKLVDPWRGPEIMVRTMFMPKLRESYQDLARACHGADLLVTHPLAFAGPLLAQKEGLRWVIDGALADDAILGDRPPTLSRGTLDALGAPARRRAVPAAVPHTARHGAPLGAAAARIPRGAGAARDGRYRAVRGAAFAAAQPRVVLARARRAAA